MSIPDAERVTGRIFITGSTGFVGRNLRAQLSGRPMRLLVRDASKHAGLKSANVEIVEGDIAPLAGSELLRQGALPRLPRARHHDGGHDPQAFGETLRHEAREIGRIHGVHDNHSRRE